MTTNPEYQLQMSLSPIEASLLSARRLVYQALHDASESCPAQLVANLEHLARAVTEAGRIQREFQEARRRTPLT